MRALHGHQGTEPLLDTFTFCAWPAAHSSSVLLETGQSELQDWEKTAKGVIRVMEGPRSCLMGMWAEWLLPPQEASANLIIPPIAWKGKAGCLYFERLRFVKSYFCTEAQNVHTSWPWQKAHWR